MVRLAGLVALASKVEAEVIVDQVLDTRVGGLGRTERGWGNREAECLLFELLLGIDDHGLRWDENRRDRIRAHLEAIPVRQYLCLYEKAMAAKKLASLR
jgi:hypothetical protein